jgi:hypothetical protein
VETRRKPALVPVTDLDAALGVVRSGAVEHKEIVVLDDILFCDEVAEAVQRMIRAQNEPVTLIVAELGIAVRVGHDTISYKRDKIKVKTGNCVLIADSELGKFILLRYYNDLGWLEVLLETAKLGWKGSEKIYDVAGLRGLISDRLRAILRRAEEVL